MAPPRGWEGGRGGAKGRVLTNNTVPYFTARYGTIKQYCTALHRTAQYCKAFPPQAYLSKVRYMYAHSTKGNPASACWSASFTASSPTVPT